MPMLTEPVHVPGYVARAAVLLLILNTISSALPAPEADAVPGDPNPGCETALFANYCDGPIRPDGTWRRCWTTTPYFGSAGGILVPGTQTCQVVGPEGSPLPPLGSPQSHIEE